MGYLKSAIYGFSWMGGFRVFSRIISFVRYLVLANLLTPSQFGVYGIALLVLAFLEVFTETGINVFLIQEKTKVEKYINTAWIVSIFRGILIAVIIFITAPLVARFFTSPSVITLLYLSAFIAFIRGFINPSRVKYQKDLQFGKEFWFNTSVLFVDSASAVFIAIVTQSETALLWGLVIGALWEFVGSFLLIKPRPVLSFNKEHFNYIVSKGKWITGAGIFQYLFRQGDDIIVGRFLGVTSLGIYQMAYRIATLPITEIADVLAKVTLPIYSQISTDKNRLKKALIRTTLVTAILALGIGILIFTLAPNIILLLGNKWLEVVPILRILIFYAVIRATINPALTMLLAAKKQDQVSFISLFSLIILLLVIFPSMHFYKIIGVGIATIIAILGTLPITFYYIFKYFKK